MVLRSRMAWLAMSVISRNLLSLRRNQYFSPDDIKLCASTLTNNNPNSSLFNSPAMRQIGRATTMARIVILFAVIIFPVLVVGSVTADNSRPSTTFDGDDEIGVAVADTSDTQEASGSQRGGSGGR